MNSEAAKRWERLKHVFHEALALPAHERESYLTKHCSDSEMRAEINSLLAFHDESPEFLESPVDLHVLQAVENQEREKWSGLQVGAYLIGDELGEGGMGRVFLAHRVDGQFQHDVALKIGKQDDLDSNIRERLRHERQVLASLNHPNIAKLLDGGVMESGRLYFAMEYVENGVPITAYCRQHNMDLHERLRLFQQVCDAVSYAHGQLVVHRDLKPSNILVTPAGKVKLVDFGLAKLLEEKTSTSVPLTRTGFQVMTPEYASPEQVRGEGISTRSDVYSLGIVLYELLTGSRPYDVKALSPMQMEQVICELDPPKPSMTSQNKEKNPQIKKRLLEGDLDNIVMKALRKEPARRYGSVDQFSGDINRYLNELPIDARPATIRYRMRKFVRRHRTGVMAVFLVGLTLLVGMVSTSRQARIASEARTEAEQRANDVHDLANALLFDFHDAIRDLPGSTPARRLLVQNAEQYLSTLTSNAPDDPALKETLAEAYTRVGEIQGDPHFPNLGNMSEASQYYEKALGLRNELWLLDSTNATSRRKLGLSYGRLGVVSSWAGANEEAINLSTTALQLLEPMREDEAILHDIGRIRSELGWWYVFAGETDKAKPILDQARTELEQVGASKAGDVDYEIDLWRVYNYQVDAFRWSGGMRVAKQILQKTACSRLEDLVEANAHNPRLQSAHRTCLNKLGNVLERTGEADEAIKLYEASLDIAIQMANADSTNTLGHKGVALLQERLGNTFEEKKEYDQAYVFYLQALQQKQRLYDIDPENGEMGNTLGNTLRSLCRFQLRQGKLDEAQELCVRAEDIFDKAIQSDPLNGIWQSNLIETWFLLADVYRAASREQEGHLEGRPQLENALIKMNQGITMIEQLDAKGTAFSWPEQLDSLKLEREKVERKLN